HAGVVDVILDLDWIAASAKHADEGVAQDGVAEVADVGGLVRVDVGVLDNDLAVAGGRSGGASEKGGGISPSIEAQIDIAAAGDLQFGNAGDGRNGGDELFGDFARRPAKLLGE